MRFLTLLGAFFLSISVSAIANPITEHPVFKKLEGKWTGTGELVDKDGHKTPIKETWTGKFTETGNFTMSGIRHWDEEENEFSWEFFANGDLIEGVMKYAKFPDLEPRFEVVLSETDMSITLNIPLSGDGSSMTIVNKIEDKGKKIAGTIKLQDQTGKETTTGSMTHKPAE